jgi:regulator of sigma D
MYSPMKIKNYQKNLIFPRHPQIHSYYCVYIINPQTDDLQYDHYHVRNDKQLGVFCDELILYMASPFFMVQVHKYSVIILIEISTRFSKILIIHYEPEIQLE